MIAEFDRPRNPFGQGRSQTGQASRELAKKVGVEIKQVYLTTGDADFLNGDNLAKFALDLGALGNVRTRTVRAWSEPEFQKLISELP